MACFCGAGVCKISGCKCESSKEVDESVDKPASKEVKNIDKPVLDSISTLQLENIKQQVCKKFSWDNTKGTRVMFEYIGFLTQFINNEFVQGVPPSEDVDIFWHQHILNTHQYISDCNRIFGFILHHTPETDPIYKN